MHQPLTNSPQDRVSVVIPAYNSGKFLAAAIDSVILQTYPNVEIIVVDDGSTDDTKLICGGKAATLRQGNPLITYIYQANQGAASARNAGIKASQSEYLLFLDSDDYLFSDAIEIGVECLQANPKAGFVFGNYLFRSINAEGAYTTQRLTEDPPLVASYATILAAQHKIQCATVLLRRSAVEAVGGFSPDLAVMEDLHLFLNIAHTFAIDFHDRVVSEYRYHGCNISSASAKMLIGTLAVHSLERDYVQAHGSRVEKIAYQTGRSAWIKFFGDRLPYEIMRCLQAQNWIEAVGNLRLILNYDPQLESVDREVQASAQLTLLAHLNELPFQASLAYWEQQLAGAAALALPLDRPRSGQPTYMGKSTGFEIDRSLALALADLSQQQQVALSTTLLAAFKILLYRYTGSEDIVVGVPTVNYIDGAVFVNAVALRSDLTGNPAVETLLQQLHQTVTLAQNHQTMPIELIEDLDLQVTFVLEADLPFDTISLDRLTAMPWTIEANTAKFDLTLYLKPTSNGFAGQWIYNSDLFDSAMIDRLNQHFQNLLTAIVTNPQLVGVAPITVGIANLPMLTAPELQQLIGSPELASADASSTCLHHLFAAQVERDPDRIAVNFEDRQITYAELNQQANQLAHYLQSVGVTTDQLVGLCVERSIDTIIGILGILKAGGAYLPIDPSNPPERSAYILADAQVTVLVTTADLVASLARIDRVICLDTDLPQIEQYPITNPVNLVDATNLAYVIYTSGSTGQPKGVSVNHANVTRLFTATADWYQFGPQDVWTLFHSFAFDFSVWEIWGALLYGGRLVVVPYFISRDPASFYELLVSEQVTVLNQTPSAFYQLSKIDERLHLTHQLSLRLVIFGGEALNLPSLEPWFDRHGDTLPQLVNMYGITETTVHVTYQPLTRADLQATGSIIGRPIPDLQVYILDAYRQPVARGVSGEMYVGGAGVASGYLRRPELTQARFIPHPFSPNPQARLYKTGDLARYLPDGNLEYIGRIDDQVKIRGFRIELGEIEAILSQHPEIKANAVIVREDLPGDKRLVAYLVTANLHFTNHQLREFLVAQLPTYMIPAVFAIVETLPLTVNGKVDRRALLANKVISQVVGGNTNPIPSPSVLTSTNTAVATGSQSPDSTEKILMAIWAEVLGQPQVGIDDNFFELGGHSISILQVAAAVEQQLNGLIIPVVKLFQYPTIAKLAAYLNGAPQSQSAQSITNSQLKNRAEQQKAANARRRR
jgi:amino acid adenylation domain-containing protein